MPIPKRNKGEDARKFMGRCMTSDVMNDEYPDQKQRVAVCTSQSRAEANKFSLPEMVQEELIYDEYMSEQDCECGDVEELTESNFVVPEESDYEDFGEDVEEVDAGGLWDNIRKKKEREGKNYKPAKKGDKDRPDPKSWKKAQSAKYQGRTVKLNKPFRTPDGPKKRSVYVKNQKGNVVKVNFGDPNMKIKKSNPERRRNFRARHNCDNPGPKWKARYWSCKAW